MTHELKRKEMTTVVFFGTSFGKSNEEVGKTILQ